MLACQIMAVLHALAQRMLRYTDLSLCTLSVEDILL
jgi:hypothetical protein